MKTQIETGNTGPGSNALPEMQTWIDRQLLKFEKLLGPRSERAEMQIFIKMDGKQFYTVNCNLQTGTKTLNVRSGARKLKDALAEAFKTLRSKLREWLRQERSRHQRSRQERQFESFHAVAGNLAEMKQESDKKRFLELLEKALPALKGYLRRRISQAEQYRKMRLRAGSAKDLLNELYLRLYDTYRLHIDSRDAFIVWLYREADRLLDEKLSDQEREMKVEDIEQLRKKERKSMEEEFSVDGDGELVMQEELEESDPELLPQSGEMDLYGLHLIIDEEEKLLDAIESGSGDEDLDKRVMQLLAALPQRQQEVYELYYLEELNPEQIALIKEMNVEEVNETLEKVREYVQGELLKSM